MSETDTTLLATLFTSVYASALSGLLLMLFTMLIQNLVATIAHRRQSHYVPGVVDEKLGHESFVFRSHRTWQNSLENVPLMFACAVLAMLAGVSASSLAITVWVYALARIVHMALYYTIATEKNPSPRSYFYMIALLANVALLVQIAITLL
ncbi:MAG: MAPEG family protein [Marinobacterium sp.]|nr:MAPEG family protein [Marinobacterium sp.]